MKTWMSDQGRAHVRAAFNTDLSGRFTLPDAYEHVTRAIEAERAFHLDRDYVIREGKIVIIDRLNGRLAEGRQWQNGYQQMLEAANRLDITPLTNPVARITVQDFLRRFRHLSGMTGTAKESLIELRQIYGLRNVVIPPFRPCKRIELPPQVLETRELKYRTIEQTIHNLIDKGRPVLIGVRDLNNASELSWCLQKSGIDHQVLTAKEEAVEADRISRAGQTAMVTVATSIAGRGTDIQLGPKVAEHGGLHVIAADLFDAARIDRQLAGRCGRQGDPGSYQKILSMEDDLLSSISDSISRSLQARRARSGSAAQRLDIHRKAQRTMERRHQSARRDLLLHDRERFKRHIELGFDSCLDDVDS